jgi:hypothetical protein
MIPLTREPWSDFKDKDCLHDYHYLREKNLSYF